MNALPQSIFGHLYGRSPVFCSMKVPEAKFHHRVPDVGIGFVRMQFERFSRCFCRSSHQTDDDVGQMRDDGSKK
jgi:hypothetical protein